MIATIIISILLLGLFGLAIWRSARKGACGDCAAAKEGGGCVGCPSAAGCSPSGGCGHCGSSVTGRA